jgi:hypothetical protein
MIRMELLSGLVVMALWVFCLVEVIGTPEGEIRNLPKVGWLMIVLLFPLAGSIAWIAAGRPDGRRRLSAHERALPEFPEYDRPGRIAATSPEGRRGVPAQGSRTRRGAATCPPRGEAGT